MNRFTHWLGWKVWKWALRFKHIEKFYHQNISFASDVGNRHGRIHALDAVAKVVDLQWPVAPTLELYQALKRLWLNNPTVINFKFPICIIDDEEGLAGKLVYDPDFNKEAAKWMLTAAWIEEQKAEGENVQ